MNIAFVLGSAARLLAQEGGFPEAVDGSPLAGLERLRDFDSPYGQCSAPLYSSAGSPGRRFLWLFRHGLGERLILPHQINYCANMHALAEAGVELVIAFNICGSLDESSPPGSHFVPDQLIDCTWGRRSTMHDIEALPEGIDPLHHVDFTLPFSTRHRQHLLDLYAGAGIKARDGGVCAVTQGPRLETQAEIARFAAVGAHYVNMTLCPEAALARELGIEYLCAGLVSNWAAGIAGGAIDLQECQRIAEDGLKEWLSLIDAICAAPPFVK